MKIIKKYENIDLDKDLVTDYQKHVKISMTKSYNKLLLVLLLLCFLLFIISIFLMLYVDQAFCITVGLFFMVCGVILSEFRFIK